MHCSLSHTNRPRPKPPPPSSPLSHRLSRHSDRRRIVPCYNSKTWDSETHTTHSGTIHRAFQEVRVCVVDLFLKPLPLPPSLRSSSGSLPLPPPLPFTHPQPSLRSPTPQTSSIIGQPRSILRSFYCESVNALLVRHFTPLLVANRLRPF